LKTYYLACDLGAESGRLMLGGLEDGRLSLEEVHRFPNTPIQDGDELHWNLPVLLQELREGLKRAGARGLPIASISADSWGVDYVLYDEAGALVEPAYHYRDARTAEGVRQAYARVSWPEIFAETGIQFLPFNTLFQLASESLDRLASADLILGVGDAINHWLGGEARYEESLASTTQLYDPRTRDWSRRLLERLQLRREMFPDIVPSGTRLGPLREALARSAHLTGVEVVASCSHDTGAAVAAVPGVGDDWAYLSSGTWSLMGVEQTRPVIDERVREANFTNEIGYGGSVRFLKNIIGLWMVQECRRDWARSGRDYDYAELTSLAADAPPFAALVNPTDPRFVSPGDMPGKIAAFCREHGQVEPASPGAFIRCVLESLALLYRRTLRQIETLTGRTCRRLHIVGGGSKNTLLNRFAANACQVPVLAGPVEATAAGNVLVQALALGHLPSLAAAREVVRRSFETATLAPSETDVWDRASTRFESLLAAGA
jgi:rhamnulokinase